MTLNPSLKLERRLEEEGRREVFYREPVRPQRFLELFEYLIYIKRQDFGGRYSFATVQVCDDDAESTRHWNTQTMHDEKVFIHPDRCETHDGKYWLIFPKVIRHIKVWLDEHTKGQVTDEAMWNILKKIGQHMTYLVEVNLQHGNLFQGIGVTTDFQPLFLNLGRETGPLIYQSDAKALRDEILGKVKMQNHVFKERVENWRSFLAKIMSSADTSQVFFPHDYTADHLKFVFNYPSSWDVNNQLRFLANMYQLCTTVDPQCQHNLMNIPEFGQYLGLHYWNWPAKLTHRALKEVCRFGSSKRIYKEVYDLGTSKMVLSPASIVIFAYNCIRHRHMEAQKVHGSRMLEIKSRAILTELYATFPYLIERIYDAFYIAVSEGGYHHSTHTIGDILTGRL